MLPVPRALRARSTYIALFQAGSETRGRVLSSGKLVALRWWATSATSERYVVIGRAYRVALAAAPHEGTPRSARVDQVILVRLAVPIRSSSPRRRAVERAVAARPPGSPVVGWPVHLPPSSSGDPRQR